MSRLLDWISAFALAGGLGMALFAMVLGRYPSLEHESVLLALLGAFIGLAGFLWRAWLWRYFQDKT